MHKRENDYPLLKASMNIYQVFLSVPFWSHQQQPLSGSTCSGHEKNIAFDC